MCNNGGTFTHWKGFLIPIEDWLESSGWITVYVVQCIESFLSVSKVKRSRYTHQVLLAALVTMARIAYKSQISDQLYDQWRNNLCKDFAIASYWFTVIDLEILLFMVVFAASQMETSKFSSFAWNLWQVEVCFGCVLCKMVSCLHKRYHKTLRKWWN